MRNGKQRRLQRDDDGTHLRVNIAEKIRDPRTFEANLLAGARFIQSQVKALPVKERENIVKEGVVIGERDGCPHGNDE